MVYIRDISEDPVNIWSTLTTFIKPVSAPRFQAYQSLFSIKKVLQHIMRKKGKVILMGSILLWMASR